MAESWKGDAESILISYVDNKLTSLLDFDPHLNPVFNSCDATVSISLHRHSVACRPDCEDPDMTIHDRNSDGHHSDNYDVDSHGNDTALQ